MAVATVSRLKRLIVRMVGFSLLDWFLLHDFPELSFKFQAEHPKLTESGL
jgi:hypothetical protein